MKLVLAIVNNEDSAVVAAELTRSGFIVTKLSTTGSYLMVGNTTLLIGSEDADVPGIKQIIQKYSKTRTAVKPTSNSLGRGLAFHDMESEVTVGGATVFVLDVDSMDKY
ncbi:MAG: cyclic-di-AMP receptor [Oscillospiraceae bacterium]|nr:cyclic-di-AMP receptor [Oscillospiraceae bacterium]